MTRVSFDPKISAGHIMTAVPLLIAAVGLYFNLKAETTSEAHVRENEDQRIELESKARDQNISANLDAVAATVERIDQRVAEHEKDER